MSKWRAFVWIGSVSCLIGVTVIALLLYRTVQTTMSDIYVPLDRKETYDYGFIRASDQIDGPKEQTSIRIEQLIQNKKPFSLLLIGVDERKDDRGRSDSLMVMAVNPQHNSTLLFSIPRDTRTAIAGHGEDKINHAYAFGGVEGAVEVVEGFLQLPIDYYVLENMEGFANLVDSCGGVTVDNEFAFNYEGKSFSAGKLTLNGEEALLYSRMRYEDPRGDFGRNGRQRQVVKSLISETLKLGNLLSIHDILDKLRDTVRTNINFKEAKQLLLDYKEALINIETIELQGKGAMIDGIYYFLVNQDDKMQLRERLIDQLELLSEISEGRNEIADPSGIHTMELDKG